MSSSFMALIAAMSLFCSLVSFLISFPLTRFRGARRNNPGYVLALYFKASVDYYKNCSLANGSESDPTLFLIPQFVPLRQGVGIIESQGCCLKTHTV